MILSYERKKVETIRTPMASDGVNRLRLIDSIYDKKERFFYRMERAFFFNTDLISTSIPDFVVLFASLFKIS